MFLFSMVIILTEYYPERETMIKRVLIVLGTGVIFALIITVIAAVEKYLREHDSYLLICPLSC